MNLEDERRGRSKSVRIRRADAGGLFLQEAIEQPSKYKYEEEANKCSQKISQLKTWVRAKKAESLPPPSSEKKELDNRRSNSLHSRFPASAYLSAYKALKDQQERARHHQERALAQGKKEIKDSNMALQELFDTKEQEPERTPNDGDASTVRDMFDMFNWSNSSFRRGEMHADCTDNEKENPQCRGRRLRSSQETRKIRSKSIQSLKSTHTCSTRSCSVSTKQSRRRSKKEAKSDQTKNIEIQKIYGGPPRVEGLNGGLPAAA